MSLIIFFSDHRCTYYRAQIKLCFISTVNKVNFHCKKIQKLMFLVLPMKYCIRRGPNFAKLPQMDLNHCILLVSPSWPLQRYFEWSESLWDITKVPFDHCKKSNTWGAFHLGKISSWKFRKHSRLNGKPAIEPRLQSHFLHETKIQQNGCCSTADKEIETLSKSENNWSAITKFLLLMFLPANDKKFYVKIPSAF